MLVTVLHPYCEYMAEHTLDLVGLKGDFSCQIDIPGMRKPQNCIYQIVCAHVCLGIFLIAGWCNRIQPTAGGTMSRQLELGSIKTIAKHEPSKPVGRIPSWFYVHGRGIEGEVGLRNNKHIQRRERPVRHHWMKFRQNDIMFYSPSTISSFLICVLEYSSDLWHLVKQRPTVLLLLFPFSENILVLTASHLSSLAIPELRTAQQNWGGGYQFIEESSSCSTPSSTPYSMTIPKPKSESPPSIQLAYLPIKTSCN